MEQDPNIEKNKPVMEDIWRQVPKETNLPPPLKGDYIRYVATDPKYLYMTGFVDTDNFTEEEWEAAFQDCKQPDSTYLISKEKFISLGKYKYSGSIKNPLDAMKIREGWYELNGWREFCIRSIIPSTTIGIETIVRGEKLLKDAGAIKNGRIFIDKAAKLRIKQILDEYPSPTRRRELSIDAAHQKRVSAEAERSKKGVVNTLYQKGSKLGDKEKKNLKETLLKASKVTSKSTQEVPTLSLKDIRKTSKTKKQTI